MCDYISEHEENFLKKKQRHLIKTMFSVGAEGAFNLLGNCVEFCLFSLALLTERMGGLGLKSWISRTMEVL